MVVFSRLILFFSSSNAAVYSGFIGAVVDIVVVAVFVVWVGLVAVVVTSGGYSVKLSKS